MEKNHDIDEILKKIISQHDKYYENEEIYNEKERFRNMAMKFLGFSGIAFCVIVVAILCGMCTYKINPGYSGVIYNVNGGIENETLGQGFHVVPPWKHVTEYPISTETVYYTKNSDDGERSVDNSINVNTKDGKQVNVSVTYAYHMDVDMLPAIFEKFRGQECKAIENGYVKNEMYQAINEVTSQYSLMDLVGDKRPQINDGIFKKFRESLEPYGIVIETFNLSDVVPDTQTMEAIQKVVNAQNALETAKIEKMQAEVDAEKIKVSAQAKADALLIEAESQAQANYKLQQSLTPMVIDLKRIEKWDGKLPQYSGMNSMMMINP